MSQHSMLLGVGTTQPAYLFGPIAQSVRAIVLSTIGFQFKSGWAYVTEDTYWRDIYDDPHRRSEMVAEGFNVRKEALDEMRRGQLFRRERNTQIQKTNIKETVVDENYVAPVNYTPYYVQAIAAKGGYRGQVRLGAEIVVWESEVVDDKNDATKIANDKLRETLEAPFNS